MIQDPSSSAPSRAAELRAAGIKIGAALVFFTALYLLYAWQVRIDVQVQELLYGPRVGGVRSGGARAELNKDTPAGWLAAERLLKEALELQPSNAWALAALADVEVMLAGAGFADRAAVADEMIARVELKDTPAEERYEARGLRLVQQGKAGEAETVLLAALARYGSVPRAIDALGVAQRASGKLAEARQSFKRAQDADWRAPRKVANYATALLEDGQPGEACAAFDRALQAWGDHLRSQIGKARCLAALARAGRTVELRTGRATMDALLALDKQGRPAHGRDELPNMLRSRALAARAELRLVQGDADGAGADALEAEKLDRRAAPVLRALALTAPARRVDAYPLWKAAIEADPTDASLYYDASAALLEAGDAVAAEKLLGSYAATLPKTARFHLALARLLLRRDAVKDAEAELEKAQAMDPMSALIYLEQGRAAQQRKDSKAAAAAYEKAAQLRDDMPEIYRQMGSLYLENRAVTEGLRAYTEALARYKAARASQGQLDGFFNDVRALTARAGQPQLGLQWIKEAREAH
jgi:tetratricopeptide (TPR) repeat protein